MFPDISDAPWVPAVMPPIRLSGGFGTSSYQPLHDLNTPTAGCPEGGMMPAGSRPSCDVGRGAKIFAHHAGSRARPAEASRKLPCRKRKARPQPRATRGAGANARPEAHVGVLAWPPSQRPARRVVPSRSPDSDQLAMELIWTWSAFRGSGFMSYAGFRQPWEDSPCDASRSLRALGALDQAIHRQAIETAPLSAARNFCGLTTCSPPGARCRSASSTRNSPRRRLLRQS